MNKNEISGEYLYYAFLSGTIEVNKKKNILNKMNVFPVADGDTGSNLISTLNSIVEDTKVHKSVKDTLNSIADAALMGARGNSGIIFAQFINGVNEEMSKVDTLDVDVFASSLVNAVPYAYRAISNPVEGTMITVIREWSEAVYKLKNSVRNFEELIVKTLEDAKRSLKNTPNLLQVLKKSSVVDSGASGFVNFLEGIVAFIKNKDIKLECEIKDVVFEGKVSHLSDEIRYRYCTEALICGENIDKQYVMQQIKKFGDSHIVAGTSKKIRIHVHTNNPDKVFYALRNIGNIIQQKVDDMKKQYEIMHNRKSNTVIVTDSIADLPEEFIEKHQVYVIPMNLTIGGSSYLDKVTIKPEGFYKLLDEIKEYPSSSQPTHKSVENIFSFLSSYYDSIICITVSKEMSGTFNVILKAAERFVKEGKQITVIDSKLNSGAQGLLVLKAVKELESGKQYEQVVQTIKKYIEKIRIYVSVDTFKYMVKGGRVSKVIGFVGNALNLKPIVSIDKNGKGVAFGKAFSTKANQKKLINIVKEADEQNGILSYSIVHACCKKKAEQFAEELTYILGKSPEYITCISPVVGLNAGKGAFAVSFITEK